MKVGGLFTDYDGTLAPLGVKRIDSRVSSGLESELRKIAARVPFGVITAKSFEFIYPRIPFASAWGCVGGLDLRLADGRVVKEKGLRDMKSALALSDKLRDLGADVEPKRGEGGEILGLGIDWREKPLLQSAIAIELDLLVKEGLHVEFDRYSPFADIYPVAPSKGRALRILHKMLSIKDAIIFIGDSPFDNSAFQAATLSMGVAHGQPMEPLECGFVIEQQDLEVFLRSLSDRGMDFVPTIRGVSKKQG